MALTKKAERTKAKLLDSAQRLISTHGFDNVSVEDITKDSGVAKGTFYHYFECKEDVVREPLPATQPWRPSSAPSPTKAM